MMSKKAAVLAGPAGPLLALALALALSGPATAADQTQAAVSSPMTGPARPRQATESLDAIFRTKPADPTRDALPNQFAFRVCNESSYDATVAVNFVEAGGWVVAGWMRVNAGECSAQAAVQKGWIYHYAEGETVNWGGTAVRHCVRHPGPWRRDLSGSYTCRDDETLVGFSGFFVTNDTGSYTWRLTQ